MEMSENKNAVVADIDIPLGVLKGTIFQDLGKFEEDLERVAKEKFVQLYKPLSRTIEAAKKKGIKRHMKPELRYYSVQWACIHGGRKYMTRGTGVRKTRTLRKEELCPAHISVVISESGEDFMVSSVDNKHNHVVAQQLFQHFPQNRRLPQDVKEDVKKLLQMKVNKHILREDLEGRLGQSVMLKDLRNLQQYCNAGNTNNITTACSKIRSKFGADCNLLIDTDNVFKGLMFCTQNMIKSMSAYPELICIDATYKLLSVKAAVYVILNEDGNGDSGIVAVGILMVEDAESLEWFLESFKKYNTTWERIENIMSDKDLTERNVLSKCFPNSQLHICIFHVLKIFQREITCDSFKITSSKRTLLLEFLQSLVYARSDKEFEDILDKIKRNFPDRVYNYLKDNWISIKDEWCPFLGRKVHNFLNRTNNRLENINAKLKMVIEKHSTLEHFLDNLFVIINSLEKEKNLTVANMINKRTTAVYKTGEFQYEYLKLLTPYAFEKLEKQFSFTSVRFTLSENGQCFQINDKNHSTTTTKCTCYFSTSMGLPCKHIFAIRSHKNENLFDSQLVLDRWKMKYFLDHCNLLHNKEFNEESASTNNFASASIHVLQDNRKRTQIMSQQEKYRKTFVKCKLIASLASEASGDDYNNVNDVLDNIIDHLQKNDYSFRVSKNAVSLHHNIGDNELTVENLDEHAIHTEAVELQRNIEEDFVYTVTPEDNVVIENDQDDIDVAVGQSLNIISEVFVNEGSSEHNSNSVPNQDSIELSNIIVPVGKRKGRPRGSDQTVIGIKRKKPNNGPLPFKKKSSKEKVGIMLSWILRDVEIVHSKEIEATDLLNLDEIDNRILETNTVVLKKFFTDEAWKTFQNLKALKRTVANWACPICNKAIETDVPSVNCDICLHWVHLQCTNVDILSIKNYVCSICSMQ